VRGAWPQFATDSETWYRDVGAPGVVFDRVLAAAAQPRMATLVDGELRAFGSFLAALHSSELAAPDAAALAAVAPEPWKRCATPLARAVAARTQELAGLLPTDEPARGDALLHGRPSLSLLSAGAARGDLAVMGWREVTVGAPHDDLAWPVSELAELATASPTPATWLERRLAALLDGYAQAGGRPLAVLVRDGLTGAIGRRLVEHGAIQLELRGWSLETVRERLLVVWRNLRSVCAGVR
jgi:hypothetical protein